MQLPTEQEIIDNSKGVPSYMKEQINEERFRDFALKFELIPRYPSKESIKQDPRIYFPKVNDMMLFYLLLKDQFQFEYFDLKYDVPSRYLWISPKAKSDYSQQC